MKWTIDGRVTDFEMTGYRNGMFRFVCEDFGDLVVYRMQRWSTIDQKWSRNFGKRPRHDSTIYKFMRWLSDGCEEIGKTTTIVTWK